MCSQSTVCFLCPASLFLSKQRFWLLFKCWGISYSKTGKVERPHFAMSCVSELKVLIYWVLELYILTWLFCLNFFGCKTLLKALLAKIQSKLSISEIAVYFKNLIWKLDPLYNNIFLHFVTVSLQYFDSRPHLELVFHFPHLPPYTTLYSHLSVSSSACATAYWFGVIHWANRKKENLDFYFCSVKPAMKQCPYTEKNIKVPDVEVLPFWNKNAYYGDLLLHTFPKEFNSYM